MPDPRDEYAGLVKSSEARRLEDRIQKYARGGVWDQVDNMFRRQQALRDKLDSEVQKFPGWKLLAHDGICFRAKNAKRKQQVEARDPEFLLQAIRDKCAEWDEDHKPGARRRP